MKVALKEFPFEPFEQPIDIISVRIDKSTGKLTQKIDRTSKFEFFKVGTEPTEYVTQDNSNEILEGDDSANIEEDIF